MQKRLLIPLFVYGQLKVRGRPNDVSAQGLLRLRGKDAAARFGAQYGSRVWGQLRYVEQRYLAKLDKFELPEYKRVVIKLSNGVKAFAYADVEPAWEHEDIVEDGVYRWGATRGVKP